MDKAHLTADALCDFAEGLMPPADRRAAEAHLASCSECRREADAMQGYFREMAGLATLKAPDRFLTKVHGRIAKASPWRRLLGVLSSPRLLPAPLAGLAVILIGVYFAFLSPRLAEQVPVETVAITSPPAPEPTVRLAEKQKRSDAPTNASPQAGAAAEAAAEPLPQVAMAPAKPRSPAARAPKADVAAPESSPVETEAIAMAEMSEMAKGRREAKAKDQGQDKGQGGSAGNKERKPAEQVVGWMDSPSAVYILDNSNPAGGDAVADQIASSRGPADLVKDVPAPSPAAPAAKAEGRTSETVAIAKGEFEDLDRRQLEADEGVAYAAPGAVSKKRSAPAAAPPATTLKPWAPLGYTLESKAADQALRNGLSKLGVKVLRQDDATGRRYELEVPATRVIDLESYLKGLGALTPSTQPLPGKKNGAPLFLTLKVVTP